MKTKKKSKKGKALQPLNLRSGPGFEHGVLLVLEKGETVSLTGEEENGFLSAERADGTAGWVCARYVGRP